MTTVANIFNRDPVSIRAGMFFTGANDQQLYMLATEGVPNTREVSLVLMLGMGAHRYTGPVDVGEYEKITKEECVKIFKTENLSEWEIWTMHEAAALMTKYSEDNK